MPVLDGPPVRLEWRTGLRVRRGVIAEHGDEVHAAAFIRARVLVLDSSLRADEAELRRILIHEMFHFVWVRLGNPARAEWAQILGRELREGANGELGWSAEWRKDRLRRGGARAKTRAWREYVCEAFCDTAAFVLTERKKHQEFTLRQPHRRLRVRWFQELLRLPLCF